MRDRKDPRGWTSVSAFCQDGERHFISGFVQSRALVPFVVGLFDTRWFKGMWEASDNNPRFPSAENIICSSDPHATTVEVHIMRFLALRALYRATKQLTADMDKI